MSDSLYSSGLRAGHPDHSRSPKKFIFDRNENLVVTRPGTQPATSVTTGFVFSWLGWPMSPQDLFSHGPCQMPPQDFFACGRHMFLAGTCLPAQLANQHNSLRNYSGVRLMMLGLFGCVTTGFFHQSQLANVTTGFVFDGAGSAMSPQDFFRPDPDGPCHHKIFIPHFKIKIVWR